MKYHYVLHEEPKPPGDSDQQYTKTLNIKRVREKELARGYEALGLPQPWNPTKKLMD
jgi:hypothetical protein